MSRKVFRERTPAGSTSFLKRHGIALLTVLLATALREILDPLLGQKLPFVTFFAAILAAGWYGGWWPAVTALVAGSFPALYFYVQPQSLFRGPLGADLAGLGIYAGVGLAIALFAESRRRAGRRARAALEELESHRQEFGEEIARKERAEEGLRENEGRLRNVMDQAPVMMWLAGTDKRGIWLNKPWLDFTGLKMEKVMRDGWAQSLHPEDREKVLPAHDAAFGERRPFRLEYRLRRHDGVYRWIQDTGQPRSGPEGGFLGFVGFCVDVSEIKEAQDGLRQSEEHLGLAFEAGHMDIWDWDPASGEGTWSRSLEDIHGLAPGILKGTLGAFLESVHTADRDKVRAAIARSLESGLDFSVEYRGARPDGSLRFLLSKGKVIRDGAGKAVQIIGIAMDVTDLQLAKDRMLKSEMIAGSVLETVLDGIITIDERGIITSINPAGEKLFGYGSDEVVGRNASMLMPSPHREEHDGYLRRYLETGQKRIIGIGREVMGKRKDGSLFPVDLSVGEARLGDRRLFTGLFHDLTEHKRAEEELERARDAADSAHKEAVAANRTKDEFLAILSHELRTPLSAILGWARLLQAGGLEEGTIAEAHEAIERNSIAQAKLIEDLLDVSRIISGKLRLDMRPIDLGEVVEAAIGAVWPAAQAKEIRLERLLDPSAGPSSGDPARLEQVAWNLLSNAIKFTPKGGLVRVELKRIDSSVEIAVSDDGMGISPEALPYVFDRFRQVDNPSRRSHGGLGLGLAIVRHLVDLHGGAVGVESPGEGKGATFRVRLPVHVVWRDPKGLKAEHPAVGLARVPEKPPALGGLRVLVVDDEPDARQLLKTVLIQCQAMVHTVGSTAEAMEALPAFRPDVILSDIGMPGEDGYELIRRIRTMDVEALKRTPAVALTAFAREEDRTRALAAGFQMHLPKPVEPADLAAVIASVAGRGGGS